MATEPSATKFLSEIDETDIANFAPGIDRSEFVVLDGGKASIELQGEVVACMMTKEYAKCRDLCQLVLRVEPDHALCKEIHSAVVERMAQLEEQEEKGRWTDSDSSSSSESSSDGSGDSGNESESEAKTTN